MATPADYALTITVNDVDVTAYVSYKSIIFDDYRHAVSRFNFIMESPVGITPEKNHQVQVIAKNLTGTPIIFIGYIVELETRKRSNGITLVYEAECADMKIRLQKSVLDVDSLTGSDADILSALLSNAYPDLSSEFDFSTNVTSLLDDLSLPTANNNILDSLSQLSDLVGGSDWRLENPSLGETTTLGFENSGETVNVFYAGGGSSTKPFVAVSLNASGTQNPEYYFGGNTGALDRVMAWRPTTGTFARISNHSLSFRSEVVANGEFKTLTNLRFTYYINPALSDDLEMYVRVVSTVGTASYTLPSVTYGAWTTVDLEALGATNIPALIDGTDTASVSIFIQPKSGVTISPSSTTVDIRMDDIEWVFSDGLATPSLVWDDEAPDADFDIDIDAGDEFAFDIDLTVGDFDDFNSVTVIGGFTDESIDWTYESDGDQEHFDIELPVKDITVYKNTGTDGSPTWTEQTLGIWGEDDLTGDGGTADVLYDKQYYWLLFNSNPSNLSKSIRITGTIEKPLRVRVENVESGDPVFATTVYNKNITSLDEAVAVGNAALAKKNAIRKLEFRTYEPTLKVGQAITVTDSNRGLDERIVINRISTKWLGASGHAEFHVFCGEDDDYGADTIIANNDKRSRENSALAETGTTTASIITDESGNAITDESGYVIYED